MIITSIPDYDPAARNGKEPQNSSHAPDEWLTIAEAARRLAIDPKQVHRYAAKLGEADKRLDMSGHVLLRLGAIVTLREKGLAGRRAIAAPDEALPALREDMSGHVPSAITFGLVMGLLATLEEKEARIRELNETLAHEREVTQTMLKALPPATEHTSTTPEQTSNKRSWWAWWRRS